MPVTCHGSNWTHVLLFPSLFSIKIRALVTEGGWHSNVGSKDKPPHFSLVPGLLLVIKNTPKGKGHNFFPCIIFNFPFWVMQWSLLSSAVFFLWLALGILDTHKAHCVLPFFLLSFGISSVVQAAVRKKSKPKSDTFQRCSCVMMEKGVLGKQGSKSEGSGLFRSPHQTFLRVCLCDQHWLPSWDTDKGKINFPPSWSCTVVQTTATLQSSDS